MKIIKSVSEKKRQVSQNSEARHTLLLYSHSQNKPSQ